MSDPVFHSAPAALSLAEVCALVGGVLPAEATLAPVVTGIAALLSLIHI